MERPRICLSSAKDQSSRLRIVQYNDQTDLSLDEERIETFVREVIQYKEASTEEIVLHFVTKERISELHEQFFNDPTPTDCITFPMDTEENGILGEVFVCPEVAKEYSPESPYSEVSLYIIHGILHLLGYDDLDPKERREMRKSEKELMNHLEKKELLL